ncbi:MAG: orotate phosphoribosyltransferase [Candidatus Undinarchaeales archaeon]|jgi:orotate phosphoribosyltransferase|nr:orotate phosphoribosyltransferase [Candidatus Undinarchaeales archaeon]
MEKKEIAEILLSSKAVTLSPDKPYTYASGIKSPIYCDNRLLLSDVEARRKIVDSFEEMFKEKGVAFDSVAGTATAGIPWAAWVAEEENAPLIYVRSNKKEHGKKNKIEGKVRKGKKTLVIEDLISTGGSSVSAVEAVKQAGAKVDTCAAIFTYEMKKAEDRFKRINCNILALTDFSTLVEVAVEKKYITKKQASVIADWNKNPESWGEKYGFY